VCFHGVVLLQVVFNLLPRLCGVVKDEIVYSADLSCCSESVKKLYVDAIGAGKELWHLRSDTGRGNVDCRPPRAG
jgi:hypothetical protein